MALADKLRLSAQGDTYWVAVSMTMHPNGHSIIAALEIFDDLIEPPLALVLSLALPGW